LQITEHDAELVEARQAGRDRDFTEDQRHGGPWSTSRSPGSSLRPSRARYGRVERNQLGLLLRIAAVNLHRLLSLGLARDGHHLGPRETRGLSS
jgi:hypothetical protein